MKRISLIIILAVLCMGQASAQEFGFDGLSKSEYRYWNFVLGLNHGFGSAIGGDYDQYMLHTSQGDMYKDTKGFTYTPGYHAGFLYNYDLLNNRMGVVAGIEVSNYGFQNKYTSRVNNMNVKETFRSMAVTVPILFKFNQKDIYRDMEYFCVGIKANMNLMVSRGQKASWTDEKFGEKVADGKRALSVAATFGANYKMFSFNINYMFMDFIDKDFADKDGYTPFNGIKGHIYLCTSLNVPMTRWLCVHNWTAEKIRRKLKGKGNL